MESDFSERASGWAGRGAFRGVGRFGWTYLKSFVLFAIYIPFPIASTIFLTHVSMRRRGLSIKTMPKRECVAYSKPCMRATLEHISPRKSARVATPTTHRPGSVPRGSPKAVRILTTEGRNGVIVGDLLSQGCEDFAWRMVCLAGGLACSLGV